MILMMLKQIFAVLTRMEKQQALDHAALKERIDQLLPPR